MIPNSQIDLTLVKKTLGHLNHAPYFLEQLNLQETEITHRKTYSFGYNYFSLIEDNKKFTHIPSYLKELCQACLDSFPKEYELGKADDYLNVIVSIYEPGYQLEPHVDVDTDQYTEGKKVDFHFSENIVGVVLKPDTSGKLYMVKADDESQRLTAPKIFELDEKAGTSYLMSGEGRHKPYYHGVSKVNDLRVSVTFRQVIFS